MRNFNDSDLSDLDEFVALCADVGVAAPQRVADVARQTIKHLTGSKRAETAALQELEAHWYASLAAGAPDYAVYEHDAYLGEMWACWIVYSRKYLRSLQGEKFCAAGSLSDDLGAVDSIIDLGCGCGYTTAFLRRAYGGRVVGTNVLTSRQSRIAEDLGRRFGFVVIDNAQLAAHRGADLVFASEYFEHFETPIGHLQEIIALTQPRALLIANSFAAKSIGHFDAYLIDGQRVPAALVGRHFNAALRALGYVKTPTKLWNSRPTYWKRTVQ